jgi:DNA-directed RNA polymerase specialized sigma24 family protein
MAKADAMFRDAKDGGYREFVQYQIKTELFPWTNGTDHPEFDDIEQKVWQTVAARIAKYEDTAQPMAWLKVVVHSAVLDYIRRKFAEKRGAMVTGALDFDPASGSQQGIQPVPAKPTHPAGEAPDYDRPSMAYARSETVGRKSTKG